MFRRDHRESHLRSPATSSITPLVLSGMHLVNLKGKGEREALLLFVLMTLTRTARVAFQKSSFAPSQMIHDLVSTPSEPLKRFLRAAFSVRGDLGG